jgi:alkylation response protein AidB-like acyl-CoA dehydrogenase
MPDTLQAEPRPAPQPARTAGSEKFLNRIAALLHQIRARAAETERLRRLPDDIVQALTEVGVFRAVQPRQWGGLELDLATFLRGHGADCFCLRFDGLGGERRRDPSLADRTVCG